MILFHCSQLNLDLDSSRDFILPVKVRLVKAMVFPLIMYGCDSWTVKKAESQKIYAFQLWYWKTLKSPLVSKEIKPVNLKGNQPWIFIGRIEAEVEALILWPPDEESQLIRKDPVAGKDWGQEEKGTIEDEMVGWHHRLDGHEFEASSGRWWRTGMLRAIGSQRVRHMTKKLNNNKYFIKSLIVFLIRLVQILKVEYWK